MGHFKKLEQDRAQDYDNWLRKGYVMKRQGKHKTGYRQTSTTANGNNPETIKRLPTVASQ